SASTPGTPSRPGPRRRSSAGSGAGASSCRPTRCYCRRRRASTAPSPPTRRLREALLCPFGKLLPERRSLTLSLVLGALREAPDELRRRAGSHSRGRRRDRDLLVLLQRRQHRLRAVADRTVDVVRHVTPLASLLLRGA